MSVARPRLVLLATCLGTFVAILDTSIVNLGLGPIRAGLHAEVSTLQWVVDIYNLSYAAFIMTGGTLADLFGRRRIFAIGLALFAAGSVVCALAPDIGVLLAGRALTGIGAALELPASLALLHVGWSGAARSRAMAIWASANGLAMGIGPTVGGVIIAAFGWRSLFWLVVPAALAALAITAIAVEESADAAGRRLDLPGQLLGGTALVALCFALIQGREWGMGAPPIVVALVVAVLAFAGFVVRERTARRPMLPLDVFRSRAFSAASACAVLMTFGMYGFLFVFPLFLQEERGQSALVAGLALLPMSMSFFLVSSLATGSLVTRFGARTVIALGMACGAAGLLGCSAISADTPYALVAGAMLLVGIGLGLMTAPVPNLATVSAPAERSGMSSGVVNVARMVGATLGVAIIGSLFVPGRSGLALPLGLAAAAEGLGALVAAAIIDRAALRRDASGAASSMAWRLRRGARTGRHRRLRPRIAHQAPPPRVTGRHVRRPGGAPPRHRRCPRRRSDRSGPAPARPRADHPDGDGDDRLGAPIVRAGRFSELWPRAPGPAHRQRGV